MGHREFVDYTDRLERDMEVLRARHDVVDLSHRIDRLRDELEHEADLLASVTTARRAVADWIDACDQIPRGPRHDLWATLLGLDFVDADRHMLAMELQNAAQEVTRAADDRSAPDVQLIFRALMELSRKVLGL